MMYNIRSKWFLRLFFLFALFSIVATWSVALYQSTELKMISKLLLSFSVLANAFILVFLSLLWYKLHKKHLADEIRRKIPKPPKLYKLKRDFIAMLSHEMKEPIVSLRTSLSVAESKIAAKIDTQTRQILAFAITNCSRVIELISDIIDIERIETGEIQFKLVSTDLVKVAEEAINHCKEMTTKAEVTVHLLKPVKKIHVMADYNRLVQVVTNLIKNAVKNSNRNDQISVMISSYDSQARVSVTDHGVALHTAAKNKGYSTVIENSMTMDMGFGLSISKIIIEKLYGKIDFVQNPDGGAIFYFDLPIWYGEEELLNYSNLIPATQYATDQQPSKVLTIKKMKILYVEDDFDLFTIVQNVLEGRIDMTLVHTLHDAKEELMKNKFDLVILDIVIPDGVGATLLPDFAKSNIPVIVFSSHDLPKEFYPYVSYTLIKSRTTNQQLVDAILSVMEQRYSK